MFQRPLVKVEYHFPGMTVLVPTQLGDEIMAVDKGSYPDHIPDDPDGFRRIRFIANIALVKKIDMSPVQTFDPPIEIRVGYNVDDIIRSNCDIHNLKLAYWDGSQWVILSESTHEYHILPPSTAQVAEARIWSWVGDPPVAWGM